MFPRTDKGYCLADCAWSSLSCSVLCAVSIPEAMFSSTPPSLYDVMAMSPTVLLRDTSTQDMWWVVFDCHFPAGYFAIPSLLPPALQEEVLRLHSMLAQLPHESDWSFSEGRVHSIVSTSTPRLKLPRVPMMASSCLPPQSRASLGGGHFIYVHAFGWPSLYSCPSASASTPLS